MGLKIKKNQRLKMMQEFGNDEASNGESTFEFIERKTEELNLGTADGSGRPADTTRMPQAVGTQHSTGMPPAGTYVTSGSTHIFSMSSQSFSSPITSSSSSVTSTVPPPSALPAFLNPAIAAGDQPSSPIQTTNLSRPARPTSSPYVVSSYAAAQIRSEMPLSQQPTMYPSSQPIADSPYLANQGGGSPAAYNPTSQAGDSTALDLPLTDGGNLYAGNDMYQVRSDESSPGSGAGMWGWIKGTVSGNEFLNKVAEKAKSSVDSMITTLDPQMKQFIYSGGDVDIVVASDKEDKVGPIRESFQSVFGRATVTGLAAQSNVAEQPVGFSAGVKGAEGRIARLRECGRIDRRQPVVAVENFLAELTPERWFDIGCVVLDDPTIGVSLHVYTQATPVPLDYVNVLDNQTPADYPLRWSGFALTIGSVIGGTNLRPPQDWRMTLGGVSRRDLIFNASKTLATIYKQKSTSQQGQGTSI